MKTASPATKALLATGQYPLIDLYQLTLVNGTVVRFTSWDQDIIYGSNRYYSTVANGILVTRSGVNQKRGPGSSQFVFTVAFNSSATSVGGLNMAQALDRGLLNNAIVAIYWTLFPVPNLDGSSATVTDVVPYGLFVVSTPAPSRGKIIFNCATPSEYFNQDVPWRKFGLQCGWNIYGPGCTLSQSNFQVSGTVLAGSTKQQIVCAGLNSNPLSPLAGAAAPSGYFNQGPLAGSSGVNAGFTSTVLFYAAAGLAASYDSIVIADNPLAYYKLDANANDFSGNGYHATVNGSMAFSSTGGPLADPSGYAPFDGATNYLALPGGFTTPRGFSSYLGGVSIECWYKTSVSDQPNWVFNSGGNLLNTQGNVPIRFAVGAADTPPGFRWGLDHPLNAFDTPTPGAWTHVVGIFRGGRYLDVYVNGLFVATVVDQGVDLFSWVNPTIGAVLGGAPAGGGYYHGDLSRFAIYGYAMDPQQIYTHYVASLSTHSSLASAALTLSIPLPYTPAAGDTFTVAPGCDKSSRRCTFTFDNIVNFGGHPFIPAQDAGM